MSHVGGHRCDRCGLVVADDEVHPGWIDVQITGSTGTQPEFCGWRCLVDYAYDRELREATGGECRVCGCTDEEACFGGCTWVEPGLCSACEGGGS